MEKKTALTQLCQQIEKAFSQTTMPSPDEIIPTYYYDDTERFAVREYFKGRLWQDLVGQLPNRGEVKSANSFMLPAAIRYYLPAYMITVARCLDNKSEEGGIAVETVINMLSNPACHPLFDPLQAATMRQDANYCAQIAAVRRALSDNAGALQRFDSLSLPLRPSAHIVEKIQHKWEEMVGGLTDDQNRAIKSFLNFLITYYPEFFEEDVNRIVVGNPRFLK